MRTLHEVDLHTRLQTTKWDERGEDVINHYFSCVNKIRVVEVKHGPRQTIIRLFYGLVQLLERDPLCFKWPRELNFMSYTSTLGQMMLRS